ncbi:MAG: hypothetical protein JNK14_08320 [Chitinophagaceae bacterium]|nr:hypothetical protein [Chitinophagaceae bacterium]
MFLHTFYTWLLANALHPAMFMLSYLVLNGDYASFFDADTWAFYWLFQIFSLVLSLPALLAGWLLLGVIVLSNHTAVARFLLWLLCVSALVPVSFLLLFLLAGEHPDREVFFLSIPGVSAVLITICIRYKQFGRLISSLYPADQNDQWPDPVKSE